MSLKQKNIYSTSAIVGTAGFIFVYDSANLGSSIKYISEYFSIPYSQIGFLIAISLLGSFFGSLFAGYFTDSLGRKKTLIYGCLIGALGLLVSCLSISILFFTIGRVIFGVSLGVIFVAAPMYITEIAPANKRGRAGAVRQILLAMGLICGYSVGFLFQFYFSFKWNTHLGWRVLMGIELFILLIMIIFFTTLLESPRWLVSKNKKEEAKDVLNAYIQDKNRVELVLSEMINNNNNNKKSKFKIKGGLVYALGICILFPVFRQLSGVNAFTYYAQDIFNEISHGSSDLAYFQSIFIGVSELMGAIFVVTYADKVGRKYLLGAGALGMLSSEAFLAYFLYVQKANIDVSYLVYIYNFFFTISAGAMLTVYISEVLPTIIRSKGTALTGMINWIADAFILYSFPLLNSNIYLTQKFHKAFPFGIYSFMMLLFFVLILFLPETKNKTLEEIADYWKTKGDWE